MNFSTNRLEFGKNSLLIAFRNLAFTACCAFSAPFGFVLRFGEAYASLDEVLPDHV